MAQPSFDPDQYLAQKAGGFDPDAYLKQKMPGAFEQPGEPGMIDNLKGMGESAVEGLGKMASFGALPYLQAGSEAISKDVGSVFNKNIEPTQPGDFEKLVESYQKRGEELHKEHPYAYTAGAVAGLFGPGEIAGTAVQGAKALMGLRAAMTAEEWAQATRAAKVFSGLNKAGTMAAEGALIGGAYTPEGKDPVNLPERAKAAAMGAGLGALAPIVPKPILGAGIGYGLGKMTGQEGDETTGAIAGAALGSIPGGMKAAKFLGPKLLSAAGGVKEDAIHAFLADPDRYLKATSKEEVVATVGKLVGQIEEQVKDGQVSLKDAKESLRLAQQRISGETSENHTIAREQLRAAQDSVSEAFKKVTSDLRSQKPPTYLQSDIDETIRDLKDKNTKASKESFDILGDEVNQRKAKVSSPAPEPQTLKTLAQPQTPKTSADELSLKDLSNSAKMKNVFDARNRFEQKGKAGINPLDKFQEKLDQPVTELKQFAADNQIRSRKDIDPDHLDFADKAGVEINFAGKGADETKPHIALRNPTHADLEQALEQAEKDNFPQIIVYSNKRWKGPKFQESEAKPFAHDLPIPDEHKALLNSLDNRFQGDPEKRKLILDAQRSDSTSPYIRNGNNGFPTHPNYLAKPLDGEIGPRGISQTHYGPNQEAFPWMDDKYKAARKMLQEAKGPVTINTSSDLIAKDGYINNIPKGSTVNLHLTTGDADLDKILFPGNPSYNRLMSVAERLEGAGIKVNRIHPATVDEVIEATGKSVKDWAKEFEITQKEFKSKVQESLLNDLELKKAKGIRSNDPKLLESYNKPKVQAEELSATAQKEVSPQVEAEQKQALKDFNPKGSNTTINARGVYYDIKAKIRELESRTNDDAKIAAKKLQEYADALKAKTTAKGETKPSWRLDAQEAKRIIQDLDKDVDTWDGKKTAGSYDDDYNLNLKFARRALDKKLKREFPEYQKKMDEIAERADLISRASKKFGKPEIAASRLMNIASPRASFDRDLLKELGQVSGKDFETPVKEFRQAQETLKDPAKMDAIKKGLPEFRDLQSAKEAEKEAAAQKSPQVLRERLKRDSSTAEFSRAQEELSKAKAIKDQMRGWTEMNAESKIKAVIQGNQYASRQLEALSKKSNKDLIRMVDDLRVNNEFSKEFRIGSRNVNFWALMGHLATSKEAIGAVTGGVAGGTFGAALGAMTGFMIDKYGPAMTKQILLGVSKLRGVPSVQALSKVGIPKLISQDLARQFSRAVAAGESVADDGLKAAQNEAPEKKGGSEKWAAQGFDRLIEHAEDQKTREKLKNLKSLLLSDPRGKRLLINASDLKPHSRAMQQVLTQVESLDKGGN